MYYAGSYSINTLIMKDLNVHTSYHSPAEAAGRVHVWGRQSPSKGTYDIPKYNDFQTIYFQFIINST